jgi:hypothetical protein
MSTLLQESAIVAALSSVRLGTYINATGFSAQTKTLDIYVWNALISGAFFSALHICEVVMRNAISDAIEGKFGQQWPWDPGFERTLSKHWKVELQRARKGIPPGSTGKVVAELKFAFWCNMLTASQDQHIWNAYLHTVFPFMPFTLSVAGGRKLLYDEMEKLRYFRNRIAHHEPIFNYPLNEHRQRIFKLIQLRCGNTNEWLKQWEVMSTVLAARP